MDSKNFFGRGNMQASQSQDERAFWRRWVAASTVGWLVGFLAGFVLASSLEPVIGTGARQGVLGYFVLGAFLGSGVGLMQWLVLRKRIPVSGRWITASATGLAVAGGVGYGAAVLAFGFSEDLEGIGSIASLLSWTLVAGAGGALAGVLQWRVLRRQVRLAGRWVLASIAGWGLGMAVAAGVMVAGFQFMIATGAQPFGVVPLSFLGGLIAGGVVLGAITGTAMVRLFREPVPEAGSR